MSKLTVPRRYATTPNDVLNDQKLSFKAKGIYGFIQSKPDSWKFSAERIAKQSKDGLDGVKSGLKELEDAGLLTRIKTKNKLGQWDCDYVLNESRDGFAVTVNPTVENPTVENTPNISKQEVVNKNSNKEDNISLFSWNDYLKKMDDHQAIHIQLISYFFKVRKMKADTLLEAQAMVKQHLKPAKEVVVFKKEKVFAAIDECKKMENDGIKWTMWTVLKVLTK